MKSIAFLAFFGLATAGMAGAEDQKTGPQAKSSSKYVSSHCQNKVNEAPDIEASLCITQRGIKSQMRVKNLEPRHAYTVWWVYFDDPGKCDIPFECGLGDFELGMPNADPVVVLGRMDSGVASRRGRLRFGDFLDDMQPSSGSQVWLVVFGHGPADYSDGRQLARQLLTPEDPGLGLPSPGREHATERPTCGTSSICHRIKVLLRRAKGFALSYQLAGFRNRATESNKTTPNTA